MCRESLRCDGRTKLLIARPPWFSHTHTHTLIKFLQSVWKIWSAQSLLWSNDQAFIVADGHHHAEILTQTWMLKSKSRLPDVKNTSLYQSSWYEMKCQLWFRLPSRCWIEASDSNFNHCMDDSPYSADDVPHILAGIRHLPRRLRVVHYSVSSHTYNYATYILSCEWMVHAHWAHTYKSPENKS